MSERSQGGSGKTLGQDVLGFIACGVGGFFAVSLVLALLGWESRGGVGTWPVEELMTLLGPWASLLLSAGLTCLGTVLFLQREELPPGRPLIALFSASLGLAFFLGAFGGNRGGLVGSAFPGILGGLGGGLLSAGLGVATLLLGLALGIGPRARGSKPDSGRRVDLDARTEAASGVSAAEAALLVTGPPVVLKGTATPIKEIVPRPATERKEPRSTRDETIRPHAPPSTPEATSRRSPPATPIAARQRPHQDLAAAERERGATGEGARRGATGGENQALATGSVRSALARPPVPAWEGTATPSAADAAEETEESGPRESWPASPADESAPPAQGPTASWEQSGLFDEGETGDEPEEDAGDAAPAPDEELEAVGSFGRTRELAEESAEDPFAASMKTTGESKLELPEDGEQDELEAVAEREPSSDHVLEPRPPAGAGGEPSAVGPGEEGWRSLVFEAGCLILEQNRVAVSMLERRFALDFDRACRVLDELQQAGLIGPYMGGRTRDILLSREEWLAHAPNAS